ncbi:DUF2268 domain-containing protein [Virgibacillus ihumii]|uniref:DUF2268 domain-containing protein n=1 Tax=Virgibacillus ihumii TaxID=2686091 RepID=UPI00157C6389|nr:DUF2268 domain-containing putative Zn-dependent protease [Virgibacillus ihumii]
MEITIQNTQSLYEKLLATPEEKRGEFYEKEFLQPYHELKEKYLPFNPEWLGALPLTGHDKEMEEALDKLQAIDAWKLAKETIQNAGNRFKTAGVPIPEKVLLGIFLGDSTTLASTQGIMGFGGIPGYIQIVIAPNENSLSMLQSAIAHDFHHNVLFKNIDWNFMNDITVAKYLAVEGLAESFAESMYGFEFVGPWVKEITTEDLEKSRAIIGEVLSVKGFSEVQKYIFGDQVLDYEVIELTGTPRFGGYAVGYHAVQAFLKKTGMSVEEATLLDGEEIMEKSVFFK